MRSIAIKTVYNSAFRVALATAFILLLPLFAMQFTDEVVWNLADFSIAGVLLLGAGLTVELAVRKANNIAYQAAMGMAMMAALILVWVILAVGLIGDEDNLANLVYFGVLAVGIRGAFIARLQPRGMAITLFTTTLAQVLVAVIALILGLGEPLEILLPNAFFVALFTGSAWLFWRAAHGQPELSSS